MDGAVDGAFRHAVGISHLHLNRIISGDCYEIAVSEGCGGTGAAVDIPYRIYALSIIAIGIEDIEFHIIEFVNRNADLIVGGFRQACHRRLEDRFLRACAEHEDCSCHDAAPEDDI